MDLELAKLFLFRAKLSIPVDIGAFIQVRFNEALHSLHDLGGVLVKKKVQEHISWQAPPSDDI